MWRHGHRVGQRRSRSQGAERGEQRHDGADSLTYCHVNASFPLADVNGGDPVPEFGSYCSAVDYRSQL
ncbi:hypothetical protein BST43_01310 [Mycobacteroides saopaulense]|uniref:Uncharacterized protein n=1 Tax=Mycobacteroides saopaulense TaxID=1578165 RepID=A0A1X0JDU2_9MYCO|nr:hypothetical protein BST43_01310 [Mycobacteroides saopaulense]